MAMEAITCGFVVLRRDAFVPQRLREELQLVEPREPDIVQSHARVLFCGFSSSFAQ